jgi:hypothetical protein
MNTLAIRIGDRYFSGFGKKSRLITAWHLAGAKLFIEDKFRTDISKTEEILINKSIAFDVITVAVVQQLNTTNAV